MTYPNLEAEMKRSGLTGEAVAKGIGIGRNTLSTWMNGANAAFPIVKAKQVRDKYFKGKSLDYLFYEIPPEPSKDSADKPAAAD